ncbi:MAG: hypothetical protein ACFCBW_07005 [Candidatus Competibacterales bacterium]
MEAAAELRRENRYFELRQHGLEDYRTTVAALDQLKQQLSPHSLYETQSLSQAFQQLRRAGTGLLRQNAPLQLWPHLTRGASRLEAELVLADGDLVDYFVEADCDPHREDLLGARSLYGLLNYYQVGPLTLRSAFGDGDRARGLVNVAQPCYCRHFRLINTPNAALRQLIDRALWGGERLWLKSNMVDLYTSMDPKRYDFLSDAGLILMQSDEEDLFELFVPRPERQIQRQRQRNQLPKLAAAIARRLTREPSHELFLEAQRGSEAERQAFAALQNHRRSNPELLDRYLRDQGVKLYSARSGNGQEALRLVAVSHWRPEDLAHTLSDEDFPPGLLSLVNLARRFDRDLVVPNRPEYCAFLSRPEVQYYLNQRGISLTLPPLLGNGTFQQPVYLYVERLVDSTAPGTAPKANPQPTPGSRRPPKRASWLQRWWKRA